MLTTIDITLYTVPYRALTNSNIFDMNSLKPSYKATVKSSLLTKITPDGGIINAPNSAPFLDTSINTIGINDGTAVRFYTIDSRRYDSGVKVIIEFSRAYSLLVGGVQINGLINSVNVRSLTRNQKLTLVNYPNPETTKQTDFFNLGEKARVAIRINGNLIVDNYKFYIRDVVFKFFTALANGSFDDINDLRIQMLAYKMGKYEGDNANSSWVGQLSHRWNQVGGTAPIYYSLDTMSGIEEAGYLEQQINKVIRSVGVDQTEIFVDRFAPISTSSDYGAGFKRAEGSWNHSPGMDEYSPTGAQNMDVFDGPTLNSFPAEALAANTIKARYGQVIAPIDLSGVLLNSKSTEDMKIKIYRSRIIQADQETLIQFKVGPTEVGRLTLPTQSITMPASPLMKAIEEMDDEVHPFKTIMGLLLNLIVAPLISTDPSNNSHSIADAIKTVVKGFFGDDETKEDWGGASGNVLVAATLGASELTNAPVAIRRMAILGINSDVFGDFINAYRMGESLGSSTTISGIASYQDRLTFVYGALSQSQLSQFDSVNTLSGTQLTSPIQASFATTGGADWGSFSLVNSVSVSSVNGENSSQKMLNSVTEVATKSINGNWTIRTDNDNSGINGKLN